MTSLFRRSLGAILALAVVSVRAAPPAAAIESLLPAADSVPGWRLAEPARVLADKDLFELIDGGAEIYHEFGFERVAVARYDGAGPASLQIEIYRMRSADAAYGVFSMMISPSGHPVALGDEARLYDEYLLVWQGPHFISITAIGLGDGRAGTLTTFAREIAGRIGGHAKPPALLAALPPTGLVEPRYFGGPIALSNLYAFGAGNPFAVREGVAGQYPDHRLFVLRYATPAGASKTLQMAGEALAKDTGYRAFSRGPNRFECVDADGNQIAARAERDRIFIRITPAPRSG